MDAITLAEVRTATQADGLVWQPVDPNALGAVPAEPGVYAWTLPADDQAVVYVGVATGRGGLRDRLRREHREVLGEYSGGHCRTVRRLGAVAHYAVTADAAAARVWEARLLHLSLQVTALVPVINGGAWWNDKPHHEAARAGADQAITAARIRTHP